MYYENDYDSYDNSHTDSIESPLPFVEEIDYREIELLEVIGKGTFGLVRRGRWKGQDVAVKSIESDHEKKAFLVEVRQLSRVCHPNIVKLHGARVHCPVCLVMEYAEGGSLYNVLHTMKDIQYTAAHAISWVLQCAKGVAYLHNMKPKALVHRDLKPPNLLLVNGGTILKICDFGTACDVQTVMTNNKGSAAWMAPEVFESVNYTEKCDVFSWGIILWEVLTRQKPFEDCGPPAFSIMWAVHTGKRPPLIKGCPMSLETLMTRCWLKDPTKRPSMSEVEHKMELISQYFPGADEPLSYPTPEDSGEAGSSLGSQLSRRPWYAMSSFGGFWESQGQPTSITAECSRAAQEGQPPAAGDNDKLNPTQASAPASLSCSTEDVSRLPQTFGAHNPRDGTAVTTSAKRQSVDFSVLCQSKENKPLGHRRIGSAGSAGASVNPGWSPPESSGDFNRGGATPRHSTVANTVTPKPDGPRKTSWPSTPECPQDVDLGLNAHLLIEPALQPLSPDLHSRESVELFEAHRRLAQWHFKLHTEISLLQQRSLELDKELQQPLLAQPLHTYYDEREQLEKEKEGLISFRKSLKCQLQKLKTQQDQQRRQTSNGPSSDEWVMVPLTGW
ncbi:mitogen-activated protein kinase kinase kinase 7-like [Ornithodoros turicata]